MPAHAHAHRHLARDPELVERDLGLVAERDVETVISYVYVTASKTFSGPVGGYSTPALSNEPTGGAAQTEAQTDIASSTHGRTQSHPEPSSANADRASATSASLIAPSFPVSLASSIVVATPTSIITHTLVTSTTTSPTTAATTAASATATSAADTPTGMSSVGIAGLVIGLLLGLGAIFSLVFYYFRKKRRDQKQEKRNSDFGNRETLPPLPVSSAVAPRLSLRPVTQFFGNFGQPGNSQPVHAVETIEEKDDDADPFGNHAAVSNPFGNHAEVVEPAVQASLSAPVLTRGASRRGNKPDLTMPRPPSPSPTEYSVNSDTPGTATTTPGAAAIAAAGGPKIAPVHRVQLDFAPSLEDELELKSGQLIRLLKEYDDGWALCIRLDRSQQGVVPRTCLSTRPVKPRGPPGPRPGRPNPNGRSMTPTSHGRPRGPPVSQQPPGQAL